LYARLLTCFFAGELKSRKAGKRPDVYIFDWIPSRLERD